MTKFDEFTQGAKAEVKKRTEEKKRKAKEQAKEAVKERAAEGVETLAAMGLPDLSSEGAIRAIVDSNSRAAEAGSRHGESVKAKWGSYASFVKAYASGDPEAVAEFDSFKSDLAGAGAVSSTPAALSASALGIEGQTLAAYPPYSTFEEGVEHVKVVREMIGDDPLKRESLITQLTSMLANTDVGTASQIVQATRGDLDTMLAFDGNSDATQRLIGVLNFISTAIPEDTSSFAFAGGFASVAAATSYIDGVIDGVRSGALDPASEAARLVAKLKETNVVVLKQILAERGEQIRELASSLSPEQKRNIAIGSAGFAAAAAMVLLIPYLPKISKGSDGRIADREVADVTADAQSSIDSVRETFHDYLNTTTNKTNK